MKAILIDPFVYDPEENFWNGKPPVRMVELEDGIRSICPVLSEGLNYEVEQAEVFKFGDGDFLVTDLNRWDNSLESKSCFVSTGATVGFVPSKALIVGRSYDEGTLTPPKTPIKEVRKRTILYLSSKWYPCEVTKWGIKYDA